MWKVEKSNFDAFGKPGVYRVQKVVDGNVVEADKFVASIYKKGCTAAEDADALCEILNEDPDFYDEYVNSK